MMKAAIITITDGANYGNRLQNYALQQILTNLGYQTETIRHETDRDVIGIRWWICFQKNCIKKMLGRSSRLSYYIRKKRFSKFNNKYIRFSKFVLKNNEAPVGLEDSYDLFVCGSDQIWNARFKIIKENVKNYLACFCHTNKKIAYAASFGTSDILPEYETLFQAQLPLFKGISVREESGKSLIKQLCGIDVPVVLDPTMLLTTEQWREIEKKPKYIHTQKYIITYFLGGRNSIINQYIKKVSDKYKCSAINIEMEFLDDSTIENKSYYLTSPHEFVWLLSHSECILTDSFHGTVFSILFHKPFCVFERIAQEKGNNMGSRIDTLLSKFGLTQFKDNLDFPLIYPEKYDEDFIETVLEKERREAINYLKSAIKCR